MDNKSENFMSFIVELKNGLKNKIELDLLITFKQ